MEGNGLSRAHNTLPLILYWNHFNSSYMQEHLQCAYTYMQVYAGRYRSPGHTGGQWFLTYLGCGAYLVEALILAAKMLHSKRQQEYGKKRSILEVNFKIRISV